jgi:benzoyl-CoA reductase subunit C
VGYLCSYVPEEVLAAAGVLPVRLLGGHELQDVTDPHIYGNFCAYCRDVLAQGLLGRYDYVDGIVLSHVCPQIRQTFDSWQRHLPLEFHHALWMPSQVQSKQALPFLVAQFESFRLALEEWLGQPIGDDALRQTSALYNRNRQLLRGLYEYRKGQPPRLSGHTAMMAVLASAMMDKAEHSRLMEEALAQPPNGRQEGVRLMVIGSENDDTELMGLIESSGAVVVIEDHCLGNRYFAQDTPADENALAAIARRYLEQPPCPLLDVNKRRRGDYLLGLARQYEVEGVVFLRQKFCDPHGWEQPILQDLFQDAGLPTLSLELDFTVPGGQYSTRIEAFVELFQ